MVLMVLLQILNVAYGDSSPSSPDRCRTTANGHPLGSSGQQLASSSDQACKAVPAEELGDCKPALDAKTGSEEVRAKKEALLQKFTGADVVARLVFSESLSTGYWSGKCKATSEAALMESIAWGIMNRVNEKSKDEDSAYYDVVFARMQFRTSFSSKRVDPFAVSFLCPRRADDYLKSALSQASAQQIFSGATEIAERVIKEYQASGIPARFQGITHFFYPQSEFFGEMRPLWAPDPDPAKNKGYVDILGANRPCVEFYR